MEVGNCLEHIVLWWGMAPLSTRPPSSCHHLREWLAQFLPAAQDVPPYILSSLHSLADALIVHITSVSWDQYFRSVYTSAVITFITKEAKWEWENFDLHYKIQIRCNCTIFKKCALK